MPTFLRARLPLTLALTLTACSGPPLDAPQVALRPDAPTTLDRLTAEIMPAPGAHALRYSFAWSRDGHLVDGQVDDTIAPELTAKGQRWRVQVTPWAGLVEGPSAFADVIVVNTAPSVTVALEPARPIAGDEALRAVTDAVDVDDDDVRLTYAWTVDDATTEHDGATVAADLLRRGQTWRVTVTPNDGEVDGEPAAAVAVIENAFPTIAAATLEPEHATVATTLRAIVTEPRDADGDPVALRYTFRVDGAVVQDGAADTLPPGAHRKGQHVTVTVTPNDGFDDGEPVQSAPLVIENTPPTAPEIGFDEAPLPGRDLICAITDPAIDADGDELHYDFSWTVDEATFVGAIDDETSSLVPGEAVQRHEAWACEVTAFDGEVAGPAARVEGVAMAGWRAVGAGWEHSCAIYTDNRMLCWGNNSYGAVGDGTTSRRLTPTPVDIDASWASLGVGRDHTCGVTTADELYCWGANYSEQIGDGTTSRRLTPTPIGAFAAWREVAGGHSHTCGITTAGELYCWGNNNYGALGDGTTTHRSTPTRIGEFTTWRAVATGLSQTCGITTSDQLYCWGWNFAGKVGDGTATSRSTPTRVGSFASWNAVVSGEHHVCGITTDDELYCWGNNPAGQIGDGTTSSRTTPTRVGFFDSWRSVAAGYRHTCATTSTGASWCWGDNWEGALGDGTTERRLTPTRVGSRSDWDQIHAGHRHTCSYRTDRTLACWGWNNSGQVGDGSTTTRLHPTDVVGID